MKIYQYNGEGYYLSCIILVIAKSKKTAIKLIKTELNNLGLSYDENCTLIVKTILNNCIIYSDNGNY